MFWEYLYKYLSTILQYDFLFLNLIQQNNEINILSNAKLINVFDYLLILENTINGRNLSERNLSESWLLRSTTSLKVIKEKTTLYCLKLIHFSLLRPEFKNK
jgi:hypothetical protein